MIKLSEAVVPSNDQILFTIEGMRNPMNSWYKSDSGPCSSLECVNCIFDSEDHKKCNSPCKMAFEDTIGVGMEDFKLMKKLAAAGTEHRKYMRMLPVYVRIIAPLYWWKEFDTYKIGTVANSCSTMHKITEKEFTLEDFSCEKLEGVFKEGYIELIRLLNIARSNYIATEDKVYWWQLIQLLPSSYNQTRNVMLNYEVLRTIYRQRKGHKLDEWNVFCEWVEQLPFSELITE